MASKLDRGAATSNLVTLDCILPLLVIIMVMMIIIMVTLDSIVPLLVIITDDDHSGDHQFSRLDP